MTSTQSEWNSIGARRPRADGSPATALPATPSSVLARVASLISDALVRAIERLALWRARTRGRRDLASFNDTMLHEIGISRADVDREFSKPFWRS